MTESSKQFATNGEGIEPGEVYKIHGLDERPLNIYAESTKERGRFEWYRIPSWPVAFLGFEEFDIRVHRAIEGYGWTLTEASTGMRVLLDADATTSDDPCVIAGFMIAQGKLTTEKIKEGIAKSEDKLKAVRASIPSALSETRQSVDVDGLLETLKGERDTDVLYACFETALRRIASTPSATPLKLPLRRDLIERQSNYIQGYFDGSGMLHDMDLTDIKTVLDWALSLEPK